MSNTLDKLGYRNEDDKAYGLAGMIVTLSVLDGLSLIHKVSLDSEGPMVEFTEEYYHLQSPSLSPKSVWETLRRNFYITSAMIVGNVMARCLVRDGNPVSQKILVDIQKEMEEEGKESLYLEKDEVESLYRHLLRQNMQIYNNPRVIPKIRILTQRLSLLRTLGGGEIESELENL